MSVLGLIPARGGSKGIPRKNVREIAGKPLIAWTIEAARASGVIDRVVVSTDDPEIAEVAAAHGAEVPFLRPPELARDETPGIDPVLHALEALPGFDTVALLQPTSPLRISADIVAAVELGRQRNAANVVAVTEARHASWTLQMDGSGVLDVSALSDATRRQDLPSRFMLNGAVYIAQTSRLIADRTFLQPGTLGYVMPEERSVDIDTPIDWQLAELLLSQQLR